MIHRVLTLFALFVLLWVGVQAEVPHQKGYCAIRGQCGKKSVFGSELPCPDPSPASAPSTDLRASLVRICGDEWAEGNVCCDADQLEALEGNLKRVKPILSSCPACLKNFEEFFCQLTCSGDQSAFLNVTGTQAAVTTGKDIVTQMSYYVTDAHANAFFDSCKSVKFSATNGYVMDFIGGGAKTARAFLAFLGEEKPLLGSPIQIDFPTDEESVGSGMTPVEGGMRSCGDEDVRYRCACVDCPTACPTLEDVPRPGSGCHVGVLPCFSLAMILLYALGLLGFLSGWGVVAHKKRKGRPTRRARMLTDDAASVTSTRSGEDGDEDGLLVEEEVMRRYPLQDKLYALFYDLGLHCATYPATTIGAALLVLGVMCLGWLRFGVETDPVRLWVSPSSPAAREKTFFDESFGPFFRAEQVFLSNVSGEGSPVLSYETLEWWFGVEERVRDVVVEIDIDGDSVQVGWGDVCYNPTGTGCVVQSLTGYFQDDIEMVDPDYWLDDLEACASQPVSCLPPYGQPLKPEVLLGRIPENEGGEVDTSRIGEAEAVIVTWVVRNSLDAEKIRKAEAWEAGLQRVLRQVEGEAEERGLRISWNTEISLGQELNKSTNTDAGIVVVSYVIMFFYVSLALGGSWRFSRRIVVESKFGLGIVGIMIVLLSVAASIGLFSAMGVKVTLIIAEVIPFLVLAIGVDNIFLLVHEFERINASLSSLSVEERAARTLGRVGPSILLSATAEVVAFGLGGLVGMPAVRNFAIYAAGAVVIDAVLQCTAFVSALVLDQRRVDAGRVDCFPILRVGGRSGKRREGMLDRAIRKWYAPNLLRKPVKVVVVAVFVGLFFAALGLFPKLELGLDQRIALPRDSYMVDYFNDMYAYMQQGPPVYFVTKDLNATTLEGQRALCGRFSTCDEFSLANVLEQERKREEVSFVAEPAASWVDDFLHWLNPSNDMCCRVQSSGKQCGPDDSEDECKVCFADREPSWNITMTGFPEGQEFLEYLGRWIESPTVESCPLAGQAAYSDALVVDYENVMTPATHFRTSHTPLRSQRDFIDAYAAARRVAKEITDKTGTEVFPYSVFYIYFDQYATIVNLAIKLVGSALIAILAVTSVILGSFPTALVVMCVVGMIVVDVVGVMALWGVSLNAVSLVNLVICVGIGVEFCSHVARGFMVPNQGLGKHLKTGSERNERVWNSLVSVGGSVFSGITLTKFIGVAVLAFTRSKIFEVYYFRMWLALVILAAAHGLIFLPVLLSLFGGKGYALEGEEVVEEAWRNDARHRYNQALLADGDDSD
ncbi:hypothetical protein G7K_5590-t1 [Saitoella complicata NRRL Y-17804]|uniref:SSD domain-containing protein n=1 Tax=Saitoella complicata (strain BCRC 22490 / CBS 7301 / JCM 7358 / NBRC 10748 / NRRL Y-17804) TaxID=698492 RepID=A0A0E9NPY7_SAICN|nr:hypothetical protein G7K_5590-t1 [Saitoella complicata NRRL Y-17804]